jgi:hypothetical protein
LTPPCCWIGSHAVRALPLTRGDLIGETAEAQKVYQEAYSFAPAAGMIASTKEQRAKLEPLLADSPLKYVKAGGD